VAYRTIQLYKYIKLPNLGWRYCKAVFYENNRVKSHAVITPDGEQTIKKGNDYISYNRKWEPIGKNPAEAQRLLLKKRGERSGAAHGWTGDPFPLSVRNRRSPARSKVNNAHDRAVRDSKVARFRLYDLRHTSATRAAESGISLVTLAALLGHFKIQIVLLYAHPTHEHRARSVERLEQFNAARQMEALLQEDGTAAGMMQ
jgi:integrase